MKSQPVYLTGLEIFVKSLKAQFNSLTEQIDLTDEEWERYARMMKRSNMNTMKEDLSPTDYKIYRKEFQKLVDEAKKNRELLRLGKLTNKIKR